MPRPKRCRKVYKMPEQRMFGPVDQIGELQKSIVLNVEEYEVIRLIDLEEMTQEECAKIMEVARTTVQGIYAGARRKIARALVHGKTITIEGGDYILCNQDERNCTNEECIKNKVCTCYNCK